MSIWYYLDAVVEKDPVHGQELSRCIPALVKKHVFGSSLGCRAGKLPNSCLRIGYQGIMLNLTYNCPAIWRACPPQRGPSV